MTLLLLLFHLAYVGLLLVFRFGFYLAGHRRSDKIPDSKPRVSVLVPFRNEEKHLPVVLDDLLKQDYPQHLLEIICIDDHSTDRGAELVGFHGNRVRLVSLSDTAMGKKAALVAGVAASDSEWILTTDADCRLPEGWANSLVQEGQKSGSCMVCGSVAICSSKGLLGVFQVLETQLLQRMGAASLALGFPLLNTGASLAFRREAFLEVGGYSNNMQVASGDDTFLMLAMHAAFPGRVVACILPAAKVITAAESDWKSYFSQRHRRAYKVRHYRSTYIVFVGVLLFLGQFATIAALALSFLGYVPFSTLILFLVLRFLSEFLLMGPVRPFRYLIAVVPVSLIFPLLNILAIWPAGAGARTWKGRLLVNKKR